MTRAPFWFAPAPGRRLAAVRLLVIGFALVWLVAGAPLMLSPLGFAPERFEPVGVVGILEEPLSPPLGVAIWIASVVLGAAALSGFRYRLSAPLFAAAFLWVTSYRNSWGMIFHTENLVVLHVAIVAFLPAADAWSLDARREEWRRARGAVEAPRYGWGLRLMATVTALTYVLAGVAKLRAAGAEWLEGEVLLSHVAFDNLRKIELGAVHSPLGAWLSSFPAAFVPLAWASMILELGAPASLLHRHLARAWVFGIWAFHVGVLAVMAIAFPYALVGIAFAPHLRAERVFERLEEWRARRRR